MVRSGLLPTLGLWAGVTGHPAEFWLYQVPHSCESHSPEASEHVTSRPPKVSIVLGEPLSPFPVSFASLDPSPAPSLAQAFSTACRSHQGRLLSATCPHLSQSAEAWLPLGASSSSLRNATCLCDQAWFQAAATPSRGHVKADHVVQRPSAACGDLAQLRLTGRVVAAVFSVGRN
jgi:hypothetical protein